MNCIWYNKTKRSRSTVATEELKGSGPESEALFWTRHPESKKEYKYY